MATIAAAVLLIVIVVAVTVRTTDGGAIPASTNHDTVTASGPTNGLGESLAGGLTTTTTPPLGPTVPTNRLRGLLLSGIEIETDTRWPTPTDPDSLEVSKRFYTGEEFEICRSPLNVAVMEAYKGTGYQSVLLQGTEGNTVDPDPERMFWTFANSVVAFPSAAFATAMVESAKPLWERCNNLMDKSNLNDGYWSIGTLTVDDGVLFTSKTLEHGRGWRCWHAMGARNNIVIETEACAYGATKADAQKTYKSIAAKVDRAA